MSTEIGTAAVAGVQPGHLALIFGSLRSGSRTLNSSAGTVLVRRTADAALSLAVFTLIPTNPLTLAPVITSPVAGQGWGEGLIVFRSP